MQRLKAGDLDSSWSDILDAYRLARLVGQQTTDSYFTQALLLESWAHGAMLAFLFKAELDGRRAAACLRDLDSLPELPDPRTWLEAHRFWWLWFTTRASHDPTELATLISLLRNAVGKGGPGDRLEQQVRQALREGNVDWDVMLRDVNRFYDRIDRIAQQSSLAERWKLADEFTAEDHHSGLAVDTIEEFEKLARAEPPANAAARVIAPMVEIDPGLGPCLKLHAGVRQQFDLARLGFALAAYRKAEGEYPSELQQLCPAFLREIPLDRFTAQPLKYQRSGGGYLLYSVGSNLNDDSGKHAGNRAGQSPINRIADDLSLQIPPPF